MHKIVWIQVVGQNDTAQIDRILLDKLNSALSGLLARGIAVKQVDDLFCKARQRFNVMLRQRRSQRCHHVAKPSLPTCDTVRIAFNHHGLTLGDDMLLSPVKSIKVALFMEQRGLGRVEVFRLAIARDAATEGNAFPLLVKNRKHDALIKSIDQPAAATCKRNVGIDHLSRGKSLLGKMGDQRVAPNRIAKTITTADVRRKPAVRAVLPSTPILAPHQHGIEELRRLFAHVDEAGALGALASRPLIRDFYASTLREVANRIGKA